MCLVECSGNNTQAQVWYASQGDGSHPVAKMVCAAQTSFSASSEFRPRSAS